MKPHCEKLKRISEQERGKANIPKEKSPVLTHSQLHAKFFCKVRHHWPHVVFGLFPFNLPPQKISKSRKVVAPCLQNENGPWHKAKHLVGTFMSWLFSIAIVTPYWLGNALSNCTTEISFTFTVSPIDSYMCKKPDKFYAYGGGVTSNLSKKFKERTLWCDK